MKPIIITLMGPTASGKTQVAIELVQKYPLEIISVDSAMIYRTMDIGTGKPDKQELAMAPHHLIDFLDPAESYSAAEFRKEALTLIKRIHARNKIPILVGGTMMYFDALIHGLSPLPSANQEVRAKLELEKKSIGIIGLYEKLKVIDPIAAERIHFNDPQRILRALEVFAITGQPLSKLLEKKDRLINDYDITELALFPQNRTLLHQRIEQRFFKMLKLGFIEEVKQLKERKDLDLQKPSMRCVGYRQVWEYLEKTFDKDTMQEKAIAATRQLAKRQLTWLRSWKNVNYVETQQEVENKIARIIY